jgi:hypothetical protein
MLPYRTDYLRRVPKAALGVPWRSDNSDTDSSQTEHRGKATPANEGRDIFNKMEVHVCVEMDRTGRPPILDTVASLRSDADSTGPSGTPNWIDVSI